jgi:anti-sigma factor RsiW
MSEHLTSLQLTALVDGELAREQSAVVEEHLAQCAACTSQALGQSLLKAATKKAGLRYAPGPGLEDRMAAMVRKETAQNQRGAGGEAGRRAWLPVVGVAAAILLLIGMGGGALWSRHQADAHLANAQRAALATEVLDQHIAALAATSPLQVVSSDRHTVKPWFQGKIPFSFNLPQDLPGDTKLEGANLTYVHGKPAAQLIYSIGKHRVSVFLTQRTDIGLVREMSYDRDGFHVASLSEIGIDAVAVGDVDSSRLWGLVGLIESAQTP